MSPSERVHVVGSVAKIILTTNSRKYSRHTVNLATRVVVATANPLKTRQPFSIIETKNSFIESLNELIKRINEF